MPKFKCIGAFLALSVPASAFAGTPSIGVSEPSLISLLAAGGIALALISKLRNK